MLLVVLAKVVLEQRPGMSRVSSWSLSQRRAARSRFRASLQIRQRSGTGGLNWNIPYAQ